MKAAEGSHSNVQGGPTVGVDEEAPPTDVAAGGPSLREQRVLRARLVPRGRCAEFAATGKCRREASCINAHVQDRRTRDRGLQEVGGEECPDDPNEIELAYVPTELVMMDGQTSESSPAPARSGTAVCDSVQR